MTQMPKEGYCEWTDCMGAPSYTECGHSFEFNEDGVHENKFIFCPYCGGNITVVAEVSAAGEDYLTGYDFDHE